MRSTANLGCEWFEQVWNQGDAAAIRRLATPGMQAHGADGVTRSADEFEAFHRAMRQAVPDLRVEVDKCIAEGDTVAVHWTARGTHTGQSEGIGPATGRAVHLSGLALMRLEGDRIAEGWDDFDHIGLMAQLGVGESRVGDPDVGR